MHGLGVGLTVTRPSALGSMWRWKGMFLDELAFYLVYLVYELRKIACEE